MSKLEPQAERWIQFAAEDWSGIEALPSQPHFRRLKVQLAHQTIEKLLKGYLIQQHVLPEKTHDLKRLAARCSGLDRTFEELSADLDLVALAYLPSKYPDTATQFDEATAQQLLEAASRLRLAILQTLTK